MLLLQRTPIGGVLISIGSGQCQVSTEEFIDTWVSWRRDLWRRSRSLVMWIPRVRLVPGHILSLSFCFLAIRRLVVFCGLCFLGLDVGPQQQYNNGAKHACVKTFGIMSLHKLFLLCFSQCLAVMNSRPPQSRTNQWAFPCIACSLESILSLLLVAFLASSH